jgi:hypothetical protein
MLPKPWMLAAGLLVVSLSAAALEKENEWSLRIKEEAQGWVAKLHGATSYSGGSGHNRIKGSGVMVDRARSVASFSHVRLDGPVDAQLTQGASEALHVVADDNIEPLIETRVVGDTLVISLKEGAGFSTRRAPYVRVDIKTLSGMELKGSGDLQMDRLKTDALSLSLSGSGDLSLGLLEARELTGSLSGSGDVQLAGRADTQSLQGKSVRARLSGSGDLSLGVSDNLDASLSGSGDLSYAGRPTLRKSVSGSGEISAR